MMIEALIFKIHSLLKKKQIYKTKRTKKYSQIGSWNQSFALQVVTFREVLAIVFNINVQTKFNNTSVLNKHISF